MDNKKRYVDNFKGKNFAFWIIYIFVALVLLMYILVVDAMGRSTVFSTIIAIIWLIFGPRWISSIQARRARKRARRAQRKEERAKRADALQNVPATAVSSRTDDRGHFITFEFSDKRRERVLVTAKQFDTILVGDRGIFNGTKVWGSIVLSSFEITKDDKAENVVEATNANNRSLTPAEKTQKLKELEQLFYSRLITQEEYDAARAKLMG